MRLKIAARKSDLARLQAYLVGECLETQGHEVEYHFRESLGDQNLQDPLWKMPTKGVFTEDFIRDLEEDRVDLVVHSWKDLPTEDRPTTEIVSTLPRADLRDVLLIKPEFIKRESLKIFSSSPRREHNLKVFLQDHLPQHGLRTLEFEPVRGNVQTRLKKLLEEPSAGALVLAKAALDRLLLSTQAEFSATKNFIRDTLTQLQWMVLPLRENPTAAAQGALAIEIKKNRLDLKKNLEKICCLRTWEEVLWERKKLQEFGGGCHLALGVSRWQGENSNFISVRGQSPDGKPLEIFRLGVLEGTKQGARPEELWSSSSIKPQRLSRNPRTSSDRSYVVTRSEAWPEGVSNSLLWVAGSQTWRKLAQRGIWVNGSFEGLGETPLDLSVFDSRGRRGNWTTLTHGDHPEFDPKTHEISYDLLWPKEWPWDLAEKKHFFWTSSSHCKQVLERFPQIRKASHSSGPGSTFRGLQKLLPGSEIRMFIDEQDWRKSLTEE